MPEKRPTHSLDLGHGVQVQCGFPSLSGTVEVTIVLVGLPVYRHTFTQGQPEASLDLDLLLLRATGALELDVFLGELAWSGRFSVRLPGQPWHDVLGPGRSVLMRFCPAVGSIGASAVVDEPVVRHGRFGRSQLCTPTVLRIFVDDQPRQAAEVGQIVKRRMFPEHPGFVFNTVACVGGVDPGTPGLYTNPTSIWFNVFFGYYQLDAPKATWSRPFAYRSARGIASAIEVEDVVRLGKSDWNWFSNWMYGVPTEHVLPYTDVGLGGIQVEPSAPERIGSTLWHGLTLRGVEVASTYESDAEDAAKLVHNTILDGVWRPSFGLPSPQPKYPQSFIPTTLDARIWMAYWEDDAAYHTVIFGGTSLAGADAEFLDVQMAAGRAVIERTYPRLGFTEGD